MCVCVRTHVYVCVHGVCVEWVGDGCVSVCACVCGVCACRVCVCVCGVCVC